MIWQDFLAFNFLVASSTALFTLYSSFLILFSISSGPLIGPSSIFNLVPLDPTIYGVRLWCYWMKLYNFCTYPNPSLWPDDLAPLRLEIQECAFSEKSVRGYCSQDSHTVMALLTISASSDAGSPDTESHITTPSIVITFLYAIGAGIYAVTCKGHSFITIFRAVLGRQFRGCESVPHLIFLLFVRSG